MADTNQDFALRKNKFVDRQVFVDMLARMRRVRPLEQYVYVSMGGRTLEDHRAVHSLLGIDMLLSFDESAKTIDRQKLNSPSTAARYVNKTAKELIDQFGAVLREEGFPQDAGRIVWLDYMRPGQLGHQLQEFRALLSVLEANDVVRISLNADPSGLGQPKGSVTDVTEHRLAVLKSRLAEFCPSDLDDTATTSEGFPKALARAVEKVANEAFGATPKLSLVPLSLIRYADGLQMLTVTAVILSSTEDREAFLKGTGFHTWPLYSARWDQIHHVDVPYLTARERALLDQEISLATPPESSRLKALFDGGDVETAIKSYKTFRRYYPNFQHVWS